MIQNLKNNQIHEPEPSGIADDPLQKLQKQSVSSAADQSASKRKPSFWLGLAREALRRRPTYILGFIGLCLAASIFWSFDLIRQGNNVALILVTSNVAIFVVALIYLADDLQSR